MKKTIIKVLAIISLIISNSIIVFAVSADSLLPKVGEALKAGTNISNMQKYPEVGNIATLPELTDTALFMNIIQIILGWAMLITLGALVVAAIYYLISRGKEEDITKAKDIIIYLLVGMGIMSAAYGIVVGITQFRFFD